MGDFITTRYIYHMWYRYRQPSGRTRQGPHLVEIPANTLAEAEQELHAHEQRMGRDVVSCFVVSQQPYLGVPFWGERGKDERYPD